MNRSRALVLATILVLAAAVGQSASAAAKSAVARGKIGSALPTKGAAARIRAIGLDDSGAGELGSDDGGGLGAVGHAAHGTIGSAAPAANAAARIAALGLDD